MSHQSLAQRFVCLGWLALREWRALHRFTRLTPAQRATHTRIPQRFVATLLALGPLWVKLGQIFSTRPDLLPPEYIAALAQLQEHVPPVSFAEVAATIQAAFCRDVAQVFTTFDPTPIASASVAQVHYAVLPSGAEVAVKVQRPHVRAQIERDLLVLARALGVLHRVFPQRVARLNLIAGFAEFQRYTLQELDFVQEGQTLDRFRANFRGWDDVILPQVYAEATAATILTMSRVAGKRLDEVVHELPLAERQRLNRRLMEIEMKMFIADGFFHADLHPGNIFFRADGAIVLIDAGMYGVLTERQRDNFLLYMLAVAQHQTRRAFTHLVKQTIVQPWAKEDAYFQCFQQLATRFYSSPLVEMSFARVYLGIITDGARYGYVFPGDLLLHAKAITTAEALLFTLDPALKFDAAITPIITHEFLKRALDFKRLSAQIQRVLPELLLEGELPSTSIQDEVGATSPMLWTSAAKMLSTNLNSFEQQAGIMKALVQPFAWKILTPLYAANKITAIIERTWTRYLDLEPSIPAQPTFGARFTVHASALIIAMYEVLLALGQTDEQATDIIYRMAWEIYTIMGDLPWFMGGTFTQDGFQRLKLATQAFRTFPFGSPAYLWQDVDAGAGVIGFDCLRCPVAEYFATHDRSELCVNTFCKLDFPLAQQWDARLVRTGTISSGAGRCDFRWHHLPVPSEETLTEIESK